MTTASQAIVAAYTHAMMQAFAPASTAGIKLADWLHCNQGMVGLDFMAARARALPGCTDELDLEKPLPAMVWQALSHDLEEVATELNTETDSVAANIATFAAAIGLDAVETDLFRFVFYTDFENAFDQLCGRIAGTRAMDSLGLTARCIGHDARDVRARLQRGPLYTLGLVGSTADLGDRYRYCVSYRIVKALTPASRGIVDIERRLIGKQVTSPLAIRHYDHIEAERDFVFRLLQGALGGGCSGINILVYGLPGTGKSEFCKVIAQALGCTLFSIGEADEDGQEPSRWERLEALRLADCLAAGRGKALLLFDEMEDILEDGDRARSTFGIVRRAGSKVYFNRLLEHNQVPVLWTANTVDEFDPAFLRRMTFAFEMTPLPVSERARMWRGFAAQYGLPLPAQQAEALARRHNVAPGLMTGAVQAVALAGGAPEEIDFVMGALAKPFVRARAPMREPAAFEPALANADVDLARLEAALCRPDTPRDVSLCFYGPPGTGKSAYARQLAGAMEMEPMFKRGSDLLSKWIGETEKRLARAFEEARQDKCFLIIDEAEGFLWSRGGASQSWEVSMVNELLVLMENHPLPFACTTNHLDRIDPAALRRFAFKVKFDFMTPAQAAAAYRQFFDAEPPAALSVLRNLTPGDFAVVAKKRRFLEQPNIVHLLEQEVAAKNLRTMKIGF